jgi:hypothetical protein
MRPNAEPVEGLELPSLRDAVNRSDLNFLSDEAQNLTGSAGSTNLNQYIGWIALGAFLLALGFFLFRPLLRRDRSIGFVESVRSAWNTIRNTVSALFTSLRRGARHTVSDMFRVGRKAEQALRDGVHRARRRISGGEPKPEKSERRARAQVHRQYFRFVSWAERQGVRFDRSFGPSEFADRVGSAFPEVGVQAETVGRVFEYVVFSGRGATEDLIDRLRASVREITRNRSPGG